MTSRQQRHRYMQTPNESSEVLEKFYVQAFKILSSENLLTCLKFLLQKFSAVFGRKDIRGKFYLLHCCSSLA